MFYDNGMSEQELIKIRIYQKEKSAYFMRVYRITVVFNIIGRSLLCSSFKTEKSLRLTSILQDQAWKDFSTSSVTKTYP